MRPIRYRRIPPIRKAIEAGFAPGSASATTGPKCGLGAHDEVVEIGGESYDLATLEQVEAKSSKAGKVKGAKGPRGTAKGKR